MSREFQAELSFGPGPLEPEVDAAPDSVQAALDRELALGRRHATIWDEVFDRLAAPLPEPLEYGDPLDVLADEAGMSRQGEI